MQCETGAANNKMRNMDLLCAGRSQVGSRDLWVVRFATRVDLTEAQAQVQCRAGANGWQRCAT
jgi:hypothetical protein